MLNKKECTKLCEERFPLSVCENYVASEIGCEISPRPWECEEKENIPPPLRDLRDSILGEGRIISREGKKVASKREREPFGDITHKFTCLR